MAGSSKGKSTEDFPPLPGKPDIGQASPSPAAPSTQDVLLQQILTMQKQQGELLEMQRQQAEDHRLLRAELQRQAQINVELEAKVAAKPGTSDPESAAKTAEQLLERRRKLDYVPAASVNPFPPRPATLTTRMPQLYDLHGSKTYDALSKKSNSSMKYECMVLAPALSYLHDVVNACNQTLDVNEDSGLTLREWQRHFHERQQAEEHRLLRDELQRQALINVELEAKVAAKPGTSDPDTVAKTAEQLLERRRKLAYVPAASVNPFPPRPATLTSRMPQLYDLHGNIKTYDALSKKSNSSMKYECLVLAPALSYLHDVVYECNETLDVNEGCDLSGSEWLKRFHAVTNSVHGVYALLCNRWTMLELRGQLEQVPGSSQRGGSDALRAKLQFVEDRVYQAAEGVVADEVLQQ
ncbi:hypothetical protein CYMTET_14040 [Cymbomonas tetramitiformis]|uniref:Uncharacterized protein n=1 Tax=Cymbomonas tetramitiformis TaxID=36881 RepID=A0AAE0GHB4_9CHLO|nr:hypothetical protein CYMTET_14040 [Cymbomonas tetramitiformis]